MCKCLMYVWGLGSGIIQCLSQILLKVKVNLLLLFVNIVGTLYKRKQDCLACNVGAKNHCQNFPEEVSE